MNTSTLNIAIEVDDKGSVKLRELGKTASDAGVKGEKSMEGMRGAINKVKGDTDLTIGSFTKLGAIGFAATLAGITALSAGVVSLITSSAAEAREMENLSTLAQMNSVDFQNAAFATRGFGIDQGQLADISKDTLEKLGEFTATGGGGFKDFFDNIAPQIGLTAKELQGLSGPDVLVAVTDAMEQANLSYEEQSFYIESIASDTTMLIPLLKDHGAALKEQTDRADELGLAISNVETKRLLEAQRATNELTTAMGRLKTHIAAGLAPAFTDAASKILGGLTEVAGGVDNLAVTISERLVGALRLGLKGVELFHVGWLTLQTAVPVVVDTFQLGVQFIYDRLRSLMIPLDIFAEGVIAVAGLAGKELTNPFDILQAKMDAFGNMTKTVMEDSFQAIIDVKEAYSESHKTLDGYVESIKISGAEAKAAADKQIAAANSVAVSQTTAATKTKEVWESTFVATKSGWSSFQSASTAVRDQIVADQTTMADETIGSVADIDAALTDFFDDVEAQSAETTFNMGASFSGAFGTIVGDIASFTGDLITGSFNSLGDAWTGLWKGMLNTVSSTVTQMGAEFVIESVASSFFHDGTMGLEDDEYNAVYRKGEIVIPKEESDSIRENLGASANFEGIVDSTASFTSNAAKSRGSLAGPSETQRLGEFGGSVLGRGLAIASGISTPGTKSVGGYLGGVVGGNIGEKLGDATDSRSWEGLRDGIEAGVIGETEAQTFKSNAQMVGIDNSTMLSRAFDSWDALGSWTDVALSALSTSAISANESNLHSIAVSQSAKTAARDEAAKHNTPGIGASATGTPAMYTTDKNDYGKSYMSNTISNLDDPWGSEDGVSGSTSEGSVGSTANDPSQDDHGEGAAQGYALGGVVNRLMVPTGDDGVAGLKFGEGIVKEDTMQILDSAIRSGSFGGNLEILSVLKSIQSLIESLGSQIAINTDKTAGLMRKWDAVGLKVEVIA
jgi:hypothetical protein